MTSKLHFQCGIQPLLLETLKIKVKELEFLDMFCIMCIDEMSNKTNLFFNVARDEVIGLEDFVNAKKFVPASNVAVIMLRGIYNKWKQPLGYFFVNYFSSADLKPIILNAIRLVLDIGFKVTALISDMGSNFVQLSRNLHVSKHDPISKVQDKTIIYIFDTPHLIKATRNHLMKYSYVYDDKKTSWDDIEFFYNKDKGIRNRLAHNLTDAHVNPSNIVRMKVKLATQVLSASVAAAMSTYIAFGALSNEAFGTLDFIDKIYNLFDLLNSSIKSNKRYNQRYAGLQYQ